MSPGLWHDWTVDYKFKLYGERKGVFFLLSYFAVVKDFELFSSTNHFLTKQSMPHY